MVSYSSRSVPAPRNFPKCSRCLFCIFLLRCNFRFLKNEIRKNKAHARNNPINTMKLKTNNGLNCNFCSEPLYHNNDSPLLNIRTEINRWLCCGNGIHADCWEKSTLSNGSSLEDHAKLQGSNRCPLCNAHTVSFKKTGKMVKSLKKWVKKKKSWAVMDLAVMTIKGINGVPQNVSKGLKMLEKAITCGDVNAMATLGGLLHFKLSEELQDGQHVEPEQRQQMVALLTKAASLNHPQAVSTLGQIYWNGIGVDQCGDKAIEYTAKAAKLNNRIAIENLERIKRQEATRKTKLNPNPTAAATTTTTTTTKQCAHCNTSLDPNSKTTGCPCKSVNYCGTECQRAHWRTHKQEHKRLMKAIKKKNSSSSSNDPCSSRLQNIGRSGGKSSQGSQSDHHCGEQRNARCGNRY